MSVRFRICLAVVIAAACSGGSSANAPTTPTIPTTPSDAVPSVTYDCTANNIACAPIIITGDAPDGSLFTGFADPSVRRDPRTGRLWLGYSWPHIAPIALADIHLAHSDDKGNSWQFDRTLFAAAAEGDPVTAKTGYSSHEVVSLAIDTSGAANVWYAAHLRYHVESGRGLYGEPASFHLRIAKAATPLDFTTAIEAKLGSAGTDARWGMDTNLASLSPDLSRCGMFNEPALLARNGLLYLFAQCIVFASNGQEDDLASFYATFSTNPADADPRRWSWSYRGKFAGHSEALEIENHNMWVQMDVATKADNSLLAIITPADWNAQQGSDTHEGCRVLEMTGGDPPALARGTSGRLRVRARILASDLVPIGPSSCGYEPASNSGIILARKVPNTAGGGSWSLHRTGVAP